MVAVVMHRLLLPACVRLFRRMPTFTTTILRRTWRAGRMFHSIQTRAPRPRARSAAVPLDGTIHSSSQLNRQCWSDCVCVHAAGTTSVVTHCALRLYRVVTLVGTIPWSRIVHVLSRRRLRCRIRPSARLGVTHSARLRGNCFVSLLQARRGWLPCVLGRLS